MKFEVGMRVRATRDQVDIVAGEEYEIIAVDPDDTEMPIRVRDDAGDGWWLNGGDFVPVAEATGTTTDSAQAAKPKFKVGDRVRYKNPVYGEATVVRVNPDGSVVVDTHCEFGICTEDPEHLEPVAVAPQQQPSTLTIQAGKFYLTRDGRKVGPMRRWSEEANHRWEADDDDLSYIWADDGTEIDSAINDSADLVAEAASNDTNGGTGYGSTAGFTVPVFDEDDFDICGYRDSDDDIVQLSVGELTAALADSLKVARKVGKTIKRGDLVILARPALVTGIDRYHASVQTDGGNYSLPLAALTAA